MSNYPLYDKTANIIKAEHECLRQGESFVWGRTSRPLDLIDKRSFTIWPQCMGKKNLKQIKQLINYRHHMISIIYLISANLPQNPKCVIPETILIGNPASNRPKSWIPDKDIRG